MTQDQRATFAKVEFHNGGSAETVYSFRLERYHFVFAILASIAAIVVAIVVLRGAVYTSVKEVAGVEFQNQLDDFHDQAQPAIRALIDERIVTANALQLAERAIVDRAAAVDRVESLASIAESLGRLDERLAAIERRLNRMEDFR